MNEEGAAHGSMKSYTIGFALSLALTLIAYVLTDHGVFSRRVLIFFVILLAVIQLFVQLIYFLHLGRESKPRWNFIVFTFAAMVVLILVLGSLWIMSHLNYHTHGNAHQEDQSIIKDEGVHQ